MRGRPRRLRAALINLAGVAPILGGGALLAGCLAVLVAAVLHTARRETLRD